MGPEGDGGSFVEVCKRGMRINADKVMLGMEEGLVCEVLVDETRLEHVSKFKYFRCVLNK